MTRRTRGMSAVSTPPLPSLAGRAGHKFIAHVMVQGFACYARGVEIVVATRARVHARVRSKRTHDVELRADGKRLLVACTCPKQSFGLDVCKHAWAALLEIDRTGGLEDLRTDRGTVSVVGVEREPDKPIGSSETKEPTKDEVKKDELKVKEKKKEKERAKPKTDQPVRSGEAVKRGKSKKEPPTEERPPKRTAKPAPAAPAKAKAGPAKPPQRAKTAPRKPSRGRPRAQ
jgi:hypothetical protein